MQTPGLPASSPETPPRRRFVQTPRIVAVRLTIFAVLLALLCVVLVLNACGSKSPYQNWAEESLVGRWESRTDASSYEFYSNGSFKLINEDGEIWYRIDGAYVCPPPTRTPIVSNPE
jgi:hypothetical protein